MTTTEKERKELEIQEFRFSVIAELGNPYLNRGELCQLIREKAKRTYQVPYSDKRQLSESCIKKWYRLFIKYGKPGLKPRRRCDAGKSRALTEEEQDLIIAALEKQPKLTAATVVKELQKAGKLEVPVAKSTLSRLVRAAGLDKKNRARQVDDNQNRKFDFFAPLECIQADCMHGFPIPDAKGKKRKAILLAFIDDATRRIVYADFAFTEASLTFEQGIKHILKAHGRPGCIYVDNGSTFISIQTKRILDILKIHLAHSTPRRPQGRGKIERFFRTLREQFLRPIDQDSVKSLADLNVRLHTYLESEYHRSPHSGLKQKTPLDAWLAKSEHIIAMDPTIDFDRVFLHEMKRKVYNDNTLSLHGGLYEVPVPLGGLTIKVLYDPHKPVPLRRPLVYFENKCYGNASIVDTYANTKIYRNPTNKKGGCHQPSTSKEEMEKQRDANFSVKASLAAAKIMVNTGEEK